jgi:hypothetical protein
MKKQKQRFLDAITTEENTSKTSTTPVNPKISSALKSISENFPNINKETLEKLSTVEGIKNRDEIIKSIPDNELLPVSQIIGKTLRDFSDKDQERLSEIVLKNRKLDSTELVELFKKEFPEYDEQTYRESFIRACKEEIASGKTEEERKTIERDIREADLLEIQSTGDRSNLKAIKNAINENFTHGSIMSEIKSKASSMLGNNTPNKDLQPELESLINKGKGLQTLEDLKDEDKFTLKTESLKLKPVSSINRTHNEFLRELKNKASKSTINIEQYEDTMNLFD